MAFCLWRCFVLQTLQTKCLLELYQIPKKENIWRNTYYMLQRTYLESSYIHNIIDQQIAVFRKYCVWEICYKYSNIYTFFNIFHSVILSPWQSNRNFYPYTYIHPGAINRNIHYQLQSQWPGWITVPVSSFFRILSITGVASEKWWYMDILQLCSHSAGYWLWWLQRNDDTCFRCGLSNCIKCNSL